jgi:hypothetical protein
MSPTTMDEKTVELLEDIKKLLILAIRESRYPG